MRWRALVAVAVSAMLLPAQQPMTFQYFYDDIGQLVKVVDSTGIVIEYVYDAVGNMLEIKRSTIAASSLQIFSFTPQNGGPGSVITILGQGFSASAAGNMVRVGGVVATVVSASSTRLVVSVPGGVATGAITVTTGGQTATSSSSFTAVLAPVITRVSLSFVPRGSSIANFQVTGFHLGGATFTFQPQYQPPFIAARDVVVNAGGTLATMTLDVLASASPSTLTTVATNSFGPSDVFPALANAVSILVGGTEDDDRDRLSNTDEITLGTDRSKPDTDGDGYGDGTEVEVGSDPRDPASTPLTVNPVREAASPLTAALNRADTNALSSNPAVSIREAASPMVAALNRADTSAGSSNPAASIREAASLLFSVQNNAAAGSGSSIRSSGLDPGGGRVPSLTLSGAEGGALIEGQTVTVSATAAGPNPHSTIEMSVNGEALVAAAGPQVDLRFTVPAGVPHLVFQATAADGSGGVLRSLPTEVRVVQDPGWPVVRGRVFDGRGEPVDGAEISVLGAGLRAEFFPFERPLSSLPSLEGLEPSYVKMVSAVNLRNPKQVFGPDPFGTRMVRDYAARLSGFIDVRAAGEYTFVLAADEGARLRLHGQTVIEMAAGRGLLQQQTAKLYLPAGAAPIEITCYESAGGAELQLWWVTPDGVSEVVPSSALIGPVPGARAVSGPDGSFEVRTGLPGYVDRLGIVARGRGERLGVSNWAPLRSGGQTKAAVDLGTVELK